MSHEQLSKPNVPYTFPKSYPLPDNQNAYLEELSDTMATEFPESVSSFNRVVRSLELSQSDGFGSSSMLFRKPEEGGEPETEMSLDAVAIVGGIYALTGAEIIRTDSIANGHGTEIIRRGTYNGEDVYFGEEFYEPSPDDSSRNNTGAFEWVMYDERLAKRILNEPTAEQWEEYCEISGTDPKARAYTVLSKDDYLERAHQIAEDKAVQRAQDDQAHAARREAKRAKTTKKNLMARLMNKALERDK